MWRKRTAFVLVLSSTGAIALACSSESSDSNGSPTVAPTVDSGTCSQACCELPQPNTACSADAGTTCTYAITCAEGLVLSRVTMCAAGFWQVVNDCPASGGFDPRGCPAAQPAPNTPCSVDGGFAQCGYSKTCDQKICDGGDCRQVHQSAQATCVQGVWMTTPLGPC